MVRHVKMFQRYLRESTLDWKCEINELLIWWLPFGELVKHCELSASRGLMVHDPV